MSIFSKLFGRKPAPMMAPVPGIKDCCLDPANLELIEQRKAPQPLGEPLPIEVRRCKVCACKHHRMIAGKRMQPGRIGIG